MKTISNLGRNEKILGGVSICLAMFWLSQVISNGNISSFSTWSLYILCLTIGTYIILPGLYNHIINEEMTDIEMRENTCDGNEQITQDDDTKNIFKYFLVLFYTIIIIFILQMVSSIICICTLHNLYAIDYVLTLGLCGVYTIYVVRHVVIKNKFIPIANFYGQQNLSDNSSRNYSTTFKLRSKSNKPFHNNCCQCCCVAYCFYIGLPILIFFGVYTVVDTISVIDTHVNPNFDSSLGVLAGKTIGHKLYFQCTAEAKHNKSQPTVLFMHGWSGSAFDGIHVSRDPNFLSTGARFCSMSRAGYDYSDTISHDLEKSNFGFLAKMTQEGLNDIGVTGNVILKVQ